MSTRCQVEFYDAEVKADGTTGKRYKRASLYHHADGMPNYMVPAIKQYLAHAATLVTKPPCSWWDGARVAGIFVAWSVGAYEKPDNNPDNYLGGRVYQKGERNGSGWGVPRFQPSIEAHGDVDYVYAVTFLLDSPRGDNTPHRVHIEYEERHYEHQADKFVETPHKLELSYKNDKLSQFVQLGEAKEIK